MISRIRKIINTGILFLAVFISLFILAGCDDGNVSDNSNNISESIHEHNYGTPTYVWNGDKCTATRVCQKDSTHKETETVTGTYVKITDATCEENETGKYVATFTNSAFEEQESNTFEVADTKEMHAFKDGLCKQCGRKLTDCCENTIGLTYLSKYDNGTKLVE